ncbi:MAG: Fe-S cluster assembly protein SufD [Chloroflexota bacterium]|nr:Fe-S cluster assembly protein SufD [Chloroflexota bacterium]
MKDESLSMSNAMKIKVRKNSRRVTRTLNNFSITKTNLPGIVNADLKAYQKFVWEAYECSSFPTLQDEAWRRTDIRGLQTDKFVFVHDSREGQLPERFLEPIISGGEPAGQLILGAVDKVCTLDSRLKSKGVIFSDLQTVEKEKPDLLRKLLGQIITGNEDKFTALAAAMADDGVLLYVPKNTVIDRPFQSLYWGAGEDNAFINHLIIWVEEGSQVTMMHESASPNYGADSQIFHDGIVEIYVGRNARLNFIELQSWGDNVWSFSREKARVMADGHLEWIFGGMGTHLTKNFSDIDLVEPGASGRMSGFYFTSGNQHLDHDTQQNHLAENTTSDLLYKGALMDESRSVWQGMIYVAPGAIGTDGYQANRNLILSNQARADSIPGLEILADDVRCTHGATVGNIEEDELFYLYSRGIPKEEAEQLLVMGFFAPIMDRIPFEGVKSRFKDAIRQKMDSR